MKYQNPTAMLQRKSSWKEVTFRTLQFSKLWRCERLVKPSRSRQVQRQRRSYWTAYRTFITWRCVSPAVSSERIYPCQRWQASQFWNPIRYAMKHVRNWCKQDEYARLGSCGRFRHNNTPPVCPRVIQGSAKVTSYWNFNVRLASPDLRHPVYIMERLWMGLFVELPQSPIQ